MILFRKIVNTLLAITLLIATTGVTLNKHYCMGRVKSVAVFHHAENCMGDNLIDPMPCCEDVSEQLKVEHLTKASFDFESSPSLYQLAIISYFVLDQDLISVEKDKPKFQNYSPPPPDRDIPVLIQSFLI
ncbi:MAG: hypothetical protein ABJG78_13035 [Cyclobacteriaceae bacterium]